MVWAIAPDAKAAVSIAAAQTVNESFMGSSSLSRLFVFDE
jgi:hypothetical protein